MVEVQESDLQKVRDVVDAALSHHKARDTANAFLHLAGQVRYSPLTSQLEAELERLHGILAGT